MVNVRAESDAQLARELMTGSEAAFERFVDAYHRKLFRFSFSMCGQREDAEEVAQETLMRVFTHRAQAREPEHFKAWVFRIAKNACLMKRRKSAFAPQRELSLDEPMPRKSGEGGVRRLEIADWSALPDAHVLDGELRRALDDGIRELPDIYKAVILMRDVEELSTEETAAVLEVSEDVVKTRLHRGRLALRKKLDEYLKTADRR